MYKVFIVLLCALCFTAASVESGYAGGHKGYILHEENNCPSPDNCFPRMP